MNENKSHESRMPYKEYNVEDDSYLIIKNYMQ